MKGPKDNNRVRCDELIQNKKKQVRCDDISHWCRPVHNNNLHVPNPTQIVSQTESRLVVLIIVVATGKWQSISTSKFQNVKAANPTHSSVLTVKEQGWPVHLFVIYLSTRTKAGTRLEICDWWAVYVQRSRRLLSWPALFSLIHGFLFFFVVLWIKSRHNLKNNKY